MFRSSSAVEQAAVNRKVGGSNPLSGASDKGLYESASFLFFIPCGKPCQRLDLQCKFNSRRLNVYETNEVWIKPQGRRFDPKPCGISGSATTQLSGANPLSGAERKTAFLLIFVMKDKKLRSYTYFSFLQQTRIYLASVVVFDDGLRECKLFIFSICLT